MANCCIFEHTLSWGKVLSWKSTIMAEKSILEQILLFRKVCNGSNMADCSILEQTVPLRKVCHGRDKHFGRM